MHCTLPVFRTSWNWVKLEAWSPQHAHLCQRTCGGSAAPADGDLSSLLDVTVGCWVLRLSNPVKMNSPIILILTAFGPWTLKCHTLNPVFINIYYTDVHNSKCVDDGLYHMMLGWCHPAAVSSQLNNRMNQTTVAACPGRKLNSVFKSHVLADV